MRIPPSSDSSWAIFLAKLSEKAGLPIVRTGLPFGRTALSPRIGVAHETKRVRVEAGDVQPETTKLMIHTLTVFLGPLGSQGVH